MTVLPERVQVATLIHFVCASITGACTIPLIACIGNKANTDSVINIWKCKS